MFFVRSALSEWPTSGGQVERGRPLCWQTSSRRRGLNRCVPALSRVLGSVFADSSSFLPIRSLSRASKNDFFCICPPTEFCPGVFEKMPSLKKSVRGARAEVPPISAIVSDMATRLHATEAIFHWL